jgi:hypothetical protein
MSRNSPTPAVLIKSRESWKNSRNMKRDQKLPIRLGWLTAVCDGKKKN